MKPPQQQALSMTMGGCSSKHAHLYTPHCVDASAECLPISRCLAPTQVNLEPISGSNHNNATTGTRHASDSDGYGEYRITQNETFCMQASKGSCLTSYCYIYCTLWLDLPKAVMTNT